MPCSAALWRAASSTTSATATSLARGMWCARFDACSRPIRPAPIKPAFRTEETGTPLTELEEVALARPVGFPLAARFIDGRHLADFGDRHVPPTVVAGHTIQAVALDINNGRAVDAAGGVQRLCKFGVGAALDDSRAEAGRIGREVDRQCPRVDVVAGQRAVVRVHR